MKTPGGCKIVSFSLTIDTQTKTTGNNFNENIKLYIRSMKSGDSLYTDNIIIVDPDGRNRKAPSMALEVK